VGPEAVLNAIVKSRLNLGKLIYHSVQNFSFSCLLYETYLTIISPIVLYGCEIWPLILGDEHRKAAKMTPLETPRRNWEDIIEKECEDTVRLHVAHEKFQWRIPMNTAMKLLISYRAKYFLTSRETVSFSKTPLHEDIWLREERRSIV
jgi:hypothetical protein